LLYSVILLIINEYLQLHLFLENATKTPEMNYNSKFRYGGVKSHQLDQVWDPTNGTLTKFTYNTTGSVTKIDDPSQAVAQDFFWNEQQQLTGVKNQQGVHHYIYDHQGERIMKSSLINTTVYLNDQVIDDVNSRRLETKRRTYILGLYN